MPSGLRVAGRDRPFRVARERWPVLGRQKIADRQHVVDVEARPAAEKDDRSPGARAAVVEFEARADERSILCEGCSWCDAERDGRGQRASVRRA